MKTQLVTIGNLTTDNIVLFDGTRINGLPGGGSLYSALAASFYLDKVGIISIAGTAYSQNTLKRFENYGLDLEGIKYVRDEAGIIDDIIYLDPLGEKKRLYFPENSSLSEDMTPRPDALSENYFQNCTAYHLSSCTPDITCEWLKSLPENAIISADPWIREPGTDTSVCLEMLKRLNCFLPSEKEMHEIFGIQIPAEPIEYIPLLKRISTDATEVICVKLGERGALVFDPREEKAWVLPPCPSKFVNVTGCGDSFCGGFLAGYLQDKDPFISAAKGIVASSFTIEKLLSYDLLTITHMEVQTRLAYYLHQIDREKNRIL